MSPTKLIQQSCPAAREVLNHIGDKWSIYVVVTLGQGPKRFNELKREIEGISQRMLTLTVRNLERDGLVARTVTPTTPPRVDYQLTRLGKNLLKPVQAMGRWAEAHRLDVHAARAAYDARQKPRAISVYEELSVSH